MKKLIIITSLLTGLTGLSSCDVLNEVAKQQGIKIPTNIPTNNPLSNEEIIKGLKNALNVGIDSSVFSLSKVNGYLGNELVKLALPPEAQPVINNISKIPGGQKLLNDAILAINKAAEDAAPEAKTIFVNAITNMSIQDGFNILKGQPNAATTFLKNGTYTQLSNAFAPKIKTSLSKPLVMGYSAEKAYQTLIDAYNLASLNSMLFPAVKQNSLATYTTQKALDGLFLKLEQEEKLIRQDPMHQVTDILKRVFGTK
jgi:hypothetical protein